MLLVLGSINVDLTTVSPEIPKAGETVIGHSFTRYPGGKGANQAVCAARLGADVSFLGKVGDDPNGEFMLSQLAASGVDVSRIERCDTSTGVAAISVDKSGENSIIVVPGANFEVDDAYITRHSEAIAQCDIVLTQHETPLASVEKVLATAKKLGKTTILNPAPAEELSKSVVKLVDILVPNEHELARLAEMPCDTVSEIFQAAQLLRARGVEVVIVTMGKEGAMLVDEAGMRVFPAFRVNAVDTTAAGDCFLGGFATCYSKTGDLIEALAFGQLVASYSVQYRGAQSSMPTSEQIVVHQKSLNQKTAA